MGGRCTPMRRPCCRRCRNLTPCATRRGGVLDGGVSLINYQPGALSAQRLPLSLLYGPFQSSLCAGAVPRPRPGGSPGSPASRGSPPFRRGFVSTCGASVCVALRAPEESVALAVRAARHRREDDLFSGARRPVSQASGRSTAVSPGRSARRRLRTNRPDLGNPFERHQTVCIVAPDETPHPLDAALLGS